MKQDQSSLSKICSASSVQIFRQLTQKVLINAQCKLHNSWGAKACCMHEQPYLVQVFFKQVFELFDFAPHIIQYTYNEKWH